jgi:hypothetical protein
MATQETESTLRGPRNEAAAELAGHDAVREAGDPAGGERAVQSMSPEQRDSATAWFMEDDETIEGPPPLTAIELNVGTAESPKWVEWKIRPLDMDTIDAIRQRARGGSRTARRRGEIGEVNEMRAALGMVVAATIDPNLAEIARKKSDTGSRYAVSPEEVLKHRFRDKPGLILQISGKVMEVSGYDDEDLREAVAAKN